MLMGAAAGCIPIRLGVKVSGRLLVHDVLMQPTVKPGRSCYADDPLDLIRMLAVLWSKESPHERVGLFAGKVVQLAP
jgi:hypothetical protein